MQNYKDAVIQFVKKEYTKTGKTPSIRRIREGLGMNNRTLYATFPGRKPDICAAAGVPYDEESSGAVEKASQALNEKRVKEKTANAELNVLRSEEEEIAAEVKQAKAIDDAKRRITEHEYQLASSPEGRRRIFSNPQRMLQFASRTIVYESTALKNPNVWISFVEHSKTDGFDLAEKLFEVAGPLKEYETDTNEEELHRYLGFKLEVFLMDREAEQKQKMMQAKFKDLLRNFRCSECGRDASTTYLVNSKLCCPCGSSWELLCVNCKKELRFDPKIDALHCRACGMFFRFSAR